MPGYEPIPVGQKHQGLVPIPEPARAKARAYLSVYEQWEAARKARTAEVERLEALANRIGDRLDTEAHAIAETPARTMLGLRAKLAIISAEPMCAEDNGLTVSALNDTRRIDASAQLKPLAA